MASLPIQEVALIGCLESRYKLSLHIEWRQRNSDIKQCVLGDSGTSNAGALIHQLAEDDVAAEYVGQVFTVYFAIPFLPNTQHLVSQFGIMLCAVRRSQNHTL